MTFLLSLGRFSLKGLEMHAVVLIVVALILIILSITPKIVTAEIIDNKNYLNFGRAGFGSISAVSNLIKINKLTNKNKN